MSNYHETRKTLARARFLAAAEDAGIKVVGQYSGALSRVGCICPTGHPCSPTPNRIQQGEAWCKTCTDITALHVEALHRNRAFDAGVTLVGEWRGTNTPIEAICPRGHRCSPRLNDVMRGGGWCRTCSGRDVAASFARFRAIATAQGVEVVGDWRGTHVDIECRCPAGHACSPQPSSVFKGQGFCKTCAVRDTRVAEADHRARAEAAGVTLVAAWRGRLGAMDAICPDGHRCAPTPANILSGQGWCAECQASMDRVYLVAHPSLPYAKVGIASTSRRVRRHETRGWRLIGEWAGLRNDVARSIERTVLATVRAAGFTSLTRRDVPNGEGHTECFHLDALDLAVDVIWRAAQGVMVTIRFENWFQSDAPVALNVPDLTPKK